MAITGRFVADFAPFDAAVQNSVVELKGLETESNKVEKALNRMVDQFSGRKLIQDANLMVEAVERLGGASQLTEKELAQVGNKAAEAAEKMRALGMDVPKGLDDLAASATKTDSSFMALVKSGAAMAAGFISAEVAIALVKKAFDLAVEGAKAFAEIVLEGAAVADVAENFERLAVAAGTTGDAMLGALRDGTHGTISDFELMRRATELMTAGVTLSGDQLRTLATGAFALAQTGAVSVSEGLDTMTESLIKGEARSLKAITGAIDMEAAQTKLATSLGGTAKQLTEEGKTLAAREAILNAVATATGRLGEQTDGLDEKIDQAKVQWQNFTHELGASVATSEVVLTGITALGNEIIAAFGANKQEAIRAITREVEDFAIAIIDAAKQGVEAAGFIAKAWVTLDDMFVHVKEGIAKVALDFTVLAYGVSKALAALGNDQAAKDAEGLGKTIDRLAGSIAEYEMDLEGTTGAYRRIDAATAEWSGRLDVVKGKMVEARDRQREHTTATTEGTTATTGAAAAVGGLGKAHTDLLKPTEESIAAGKRWAAAMEQIAASGDDWHDTWDALDPVLQQTILTRLEAGHSAETIAAAEGLATIQVKAGTKELKERADAQKWYIEYSKEMAQLQAEVTAAEAAASGTTTDAKLADIDRWATQYRAELLANGMATDDAEKLIMRLSAAKKDAVLYDLDELSKHSRAYLEEQAAAATRNYDRAMADMDNYSPEFLAKLRDTMDKANAAVATFGTQFDTTFDHVRGKGKDTTDAMSTNFMQFGVLVTGATEGAAAAMSRSFMENGVLVVGAARTTADGIANAHIEAARKVTTTWSDAMAAVAAGQGTMSGTIPQGPMADRATIQKAFAAGRYFGPVLSRAGKAYAVDWAALGMSPWEGGMASGGPVSAGSTYTVGERGPELFVPSTSGTIIPNGGTTNSAVTNNFYINGTGADVARVVTAELTRLMRVGRKWPAV
jgi:hypothetical protein